MSYLRRIAAAPKMSLKMVELITVDMAGKSKQERERVREIVISVHW
jgi:hypothetical protein